MSKLNKFGSFVATVLRKMKKGADLYGDTSFSADPLQLLGEIQEELIDICGWSYILYQRLEKVKGKLDAQWIRTHLEDEPEEDFKVGGTE